MEYTEGEWNVTNSAFSRWNTFRGKRTGARTFVTANGIELDQVAEVQGDTDEEAEANAHLISAAPNCYKELKESNICLILLLERLTKPEEIKAIKDQINNNNKVLAKAEGK